MTIATLFAQVQARVAAEARLRYLADHDDLTGLHNRRALLQHLDQRLAPGQPGPVAALFLDLDRLKAINDYLATPPVTSSSMCSPNGSVTHSLARA